MAGLRINQSTLADGLKIVDGATTANVKLDANGVLNIAGTRLGIASTSAYTAPADTSDQYAAMTVKLHSTDNAERVSTNNLTTVYLDAHYTYTGAAATGANYVIRTIPIIDGSANPGVTYVADFHGQWENTSGSGSLIAVTGEAEILAAATGTTGAMVGVSGEVVARTGASGTIERADNLRAHSKSESSTLTFNKLYGVNVVHTHTTGTITSYYGVSVVPTYTAGTITTLYGVYLDIASGLGGGTAWGLFSSGDAPNYLKGETRVEDGLKVGTNATEFTVSAAGNVTNAGTLTSTGLVVASSGVSVYIAGSSEGRITSDATDGLIIRGRSGSNSDVTLAASDGTDALYVDGSGYLIPVLPTSSAGLPTGALWNNSGVVNVA